MNISIKSICILVVLTLQINFSIIRSQVDLLRNDSLLFNIEGTAIKLQNLKGNNVIIPRYTFFSRSQPSPIVSNPGEESDNPLIHGAAFFSFNVKYKYKNSLKLQLNLISEFRGISYGVFNTNNTIVYPIVYGLAKDTFSLLNKSFIVDVCAGNLFSNSPGDELLFYNVNKHGLSVDLKHKNNGIALVYYPDHTRGIGLNIDEYVSLEPYIGITKEIKLSLGLLYVDKSRTSGFNKSPLMLRNTIALNQEKYSVYLQGILRLTSNRYEYNDTPLRANSIDKFAFGIGARARFKSNIIKSENSTNLRFYGKVFNIDHIDRGVTYRDTTINTLYANTFGNNLYPLDYYNNNFNQWAVSTEYQNMNVLTMDLVSNNILALDKKHSLLLNIDFVLLQVESLPVFLYSFYEFGYNYSFNQNIRASVFLTNKGMNLDVHYPTFNMYKIPAVGIRLSKSIAQKNDEF